MADLPQVRVVSLPPPSTDELLERLRVFARARATSELRLINLKIEAIQDALRVGGLSIDNERYARRILEDLLNHGALLQEALATTKATE